MSDAMEIGEFIADKDGWFYHVVSGQLVRMEEGKLVNKEGYVVWESDEVPVDDRDEEEL